MPVIVLCVHSVESVTHLYMDDHRFMTSHTFVSYLETSVFQIVSVVDISIGRHAKHINKLNRG